MARPKDERWHGELIPVEPVQPDPTKGIQGYRSVWDHEHFSRPRVLEWHDDFLYGTYQTEALATLGAFGVPALLVGPWGLVQSGTGAACGPSAQGVDATSRCVGVANLATGTTTTGRVALTTSPLSVLFGRGQQHKLSARVMIPTLSTAAQEFTVVVGFHDGLAGGSIHAGNGVYWLYDRATFGDKWIAYQRDNSTAAASAGLAEVPIVAGQWYDLGIEVEHDTDEPMAWYEIDGHHRFVNINTQVPVTAGRTCGMGLRILKSAGTTERNLYCDFWRYQLRQAPRGGAW